MDTIINNINISINIEFNLQNKFLSYFKISNNNPLGNIIINEEFIYLYYSKLQNIKVSFMFQNYLNKCNNLENYDVLDNISLSSNSDIEEEKDNRLNYIKELIEYIKIYRNYNIKIKNVYEFNSEKNNECPICYCYNNNNFLINLCENNHVICNKCLIKLFENNKIFKCPICRENINFSYDNTCKDKKKELNFFINKLNHIKFYVY